MEKGKFVAPLLLLLSLYYPTSYKCQQTSKALIISFVFPLSNALGRYYIKKALAGWFLYRMYNYKKAC